MTIACPDCGTLQELPPLTGRGTAVCVTCENELEKTAGRSVTASLACSLTAFLLLIPGNALPFLSVSFFGVRRDNLIMLGVAGLWAHQWILLSLLSGIFVVVVPFIRFGLLTAALGAVRLGRRPPWLGRVFRWVIWLDAWSMPDVFLLAAFVGYYRMIHLSASNVSVEIGGECFIGAAVMTMLSRALIDRRTVWRAVGPEAKVEPGEATISCTTCDLVLPLAREGEPCPRCGAKLFARKGDALARTGALLLAAFILGFPANLLPMNTSYQLGEHVNYTIFKGISELFANGLWLLGVLIFCTSILIPFGKIFAIAWCMVSVVGRSRKRLLAKTKLFRFIAELGRWSNTDPYTIVFFVPLMHFDGLASADAGWGATAFIAMTFLTMIASYTFDPRLMWDAAEESAREAGPRALSRAERRRRTWTRIKDLFWKESPRRQRPLRDTRSISC